MASPYVERAAGRIAFHLGQPLDRAQHPWWQEGYTEAQKAQQEGRAHPLGPMPQSVNT